MSATVAMVYELQLLAAKVDKLTELVKASAVKKEKKTTKINDGVKELVAYYCELFEEYVGFKPALSGRTFKAAKDILKAMSPAEAYDTLEQAWADPFFADKIRELYYIGNNPNKYRRPMRPAPAEPGPTQFLSPWDRAAPDDPEIQNANRELDEKLGL